MKLLQRNVLRFPPAIQDRLDEVAELASGALHCKVPRAAVVRAAVDDWLGAVESADPALLVEAIRTSMVPRGRKARG